MKTRKSFLQNQLRRRDIGTVPWPKLIANFCGVQSLRCLPPLYSPHPSPLPIFLAPFASSPRGIDQRSEQARERERDERMLFCNSVRPKCRARAIILKARNRSGDVNYQCLKPRGPELRDTLSNDVSLVGKNRLVFTVYRLMGPRFLARLPLNDCARWPPHEIAGMIVYDVRAFLGNYT